MRWNADRSVYEPVPVVRRPNEGADTWRPRRQTFEIYRGHAARGNYAQAYVRPGTSPDDPKTIRWGMRMVRVPQEGDAPNTPYKIVHDDPAQFMPGWRPYEQPVGLEEARQARASMSPAQYQQWLEQKQAALTQEWIARMKAVDPYFMEQRRILPKGLIRDKDGRVVGESYGEEGLPDPRWDFTWEDYLRDPTLGGRWETKLGINWIEHALKPEHLVKKYGYGSGGWQRDPETGMFREGFDPEQAWLTRYARISAEREEEKRKKREREERRQADQEADDFPGGDDADAVDDDREGREADQLVEVPRVTGLLLRTGRARLGKLRLLTSVTHEEVLKETKDAGKITKQSPGAGEAVPAGTTVLVTVGRLSGGEKSDATPEYEAVPKLTGKTRFSAMTALRSLGLVGIPIKRPGPRSGYVFSQSPAQGTRITKGSSVIIYVAGPQRTGGVGAWFGRMDADDVRVTLSPAQDDWQRQQLEKRAREGKLRPGEGWTGFGPIRFGMMKDEGPRVSLTPGYSNLPGDGPTHGVPLPGLESPSAFEAAPDHMSVVMPLVRGLTLEGARRVLAEADLHARIADAAPQNAPPNAKVVGQWPAPGSRLRAGEVVALFPEESSAPRPGGGGAGSSRPKGAHRAGENGRPQAGMGPLPPSWLGEGGNDPGGPGGGGATLPESSGVPATASPSTWRAPQELHEPSSDLSRPDILFSPNERDDLPPQPGVPSSQAPLESVEVPSLYRMTWRKANAAARRVGLRTIVSVDWDHNSIVAAQKPTAGQWVSLGTKIQLFPLKVGVPRVVGLNQAQAESILQEAGLRWETTSSDPGASHVVWQHPEPSTLVAPGTNVRLRIGFYTTGDHEMVEVPNVVGMSTTEADLDLGDLGLTPEFRQGRVQGTVLAQVPAPGSFVRKGAGVQLLLDVEPVPNVQGMHPSRARELLRPWKRGVALSGPEGPNSRVRQQSPLPGELLSLSLGRPVIRAFATIAVPVRERLQREDDELVKNCDEIVQQAPLLGAELQRIYVAIMTRQMVVSQAASSGVGNPTIGIWKQTFSTEAKRLLGLAEGIRESILDEWRDALRVLDGASGGDLTCDPRRWRELEEEFQRLLSLTRVLEAYSEATSLWAFADSAHGLFGMGTRATARDVFFPWVRQLNASMHSLSRVQSLHELDALAADVSERWEDAKSRHRELIEDMHSRLDEFLNQLTNPIDMAISLLIPAGGRAVAALLGRGAARSRALVAYFRRAKRARARAPSGTVVGAPAKIAPRGSTRGLTPRPSRSQATSGMSRAKVDWNRKRAGQSGVPRRRSPLRRRVHPHRRRKPEDWPSDEAASRVRDLAAQGHGPQRHEGQVSRKDHDARVIDGIDPATGQALPYVPKQSSSFRSNEAYAQAEMMARQSREFLKGAAERQATVKVRDLSLQEALGRHYRRHVEGRTTLGVPSGSTRATDFGGGRVVAIYRRNSQGGYDLVTMYPSGS